MENNKPAQEKKKLSLLDFQRMQQERTPVSFLTAYNVWQARIAEHAKIDMLLVGDSLGMVELGYQTTIPVTMDDMIRHSEAVRRGAPKTFIIGDMPFMSYQISNEEAIRNAGRFIQVGCDAVKCEGGERVAERVKAMVDAGIVVMGHLGLTPQNMAQLGGYKVQGKTNEQINILVRDAQSLEAAGASFILLEGMPPEAGGAIHGSVAIPTYGIGAGPHVDGQLLIFHDLFGLYDRFTPHFAKQYAKINDLIFEGLCEYNSEVKNRVFPSKEFWY